MADKFGRNYTLYAQISPNDPAVVSIGSPFTVEFDIEKLVDAQGNSSTFKIFNLNPYTRSKLRFDFYNNDINRRLTFFAGYGNTLSKLYDGNITRASSSREGDTFITTIESAEGAISDGNSEGNFTFNSGVTRAFMLQTMAQQLSTNTNGAIQVGAISDYSQKNMRATSFSGNIIDSMNEISGGGVFFDNGLVNVLQDGDYISGEGYPILNAATGLLGTPQREVKFIRVTVLFEPRIKLGQIIKLQSLTADETINGNFKVVALKHRGTISDAVCGEAITELTLNPDIIEEV